MKKIIILLAFLITALFSESNNISSEATIISVASPSEGHLFKISEKNGKQLAEGDIIREGDFIATIKDNNGHKIHITCGIPGKIIYVNPNFKNHLKVSKDELLIKVKKTDIIIQGSKINSKKEKQITLKQLFKNLVMSTGIFAVIENNKLDFADGAGRVLMILIGLLLIYLGISKGFEPLLLLPIGMGAVLANIPLAFINEDGGILHYIYVVGIETGVFPLIIFMGVGAMTDFGPLIANPRTSLLGAAAQFGIFTTLIGAVLLTQHVDAIAFSLRDAASIGIIGGADGPTSIFVASRLSPRLLGSIAVAAYSYMALVPIIQPPIMRLLTTKKERQIEMKQLRYVSKREKIIFPLLVIGLCILLLPSATPLIGFLMFGNLMKESGVVNRLSDTTQNSLINIVTIFLGLGVGSKLSAGKFLNIETLGILVLGLIAFSFGTAAGVIMAKIMNKFSKNKINPLIGSAGVSAVPMAARVANKVGLEDNPHNFLLMHAMGPNVAGVIGSAVAAGILLVYFM